MKYFDLLQQTKRIIETSSGITLCIRYQSIPHLAQGILIIPGVAKVDVFFNGSHLIIRHVVGLFWEVDAVLAELSKVGGIEQFIDIDDAKRFNDKLRTQLQNWYDSLLTGREKRQSTVSQPWGTEGLQIHWRASLDETAWMERRWTLGRYYIEEHWGSLTPSGWKDGLAFKLPPVSCGECLEIISPTGTKFYLGNSSKTIWVEYLDEAGKSELVPVVRLWEYGPHQPQ